MGGTSRFDCFPSDFLNGIIGLSADEIAVYTVVMLLQYDRGKPVAYVGREREIATRSGRLPPGRLSKAVERLCEVGKLEMVSGCLSNPRAVAELAKIAERIERNRPNSAKGGESTRQKWSEKSNENNDPGGPSARPVGVVSPGSLPSSPCPLPTTTLDTQAKDLSHDDLNELLHDAVLKGGGKFKRDGVPALAPIRGLIDAGYALGTEILPTIIVRSNGREISSYAYFVDAVHESRVSRLDAAKPRLFPTRSSPALRPIRAEFRDPINQAYEELLHERRERRQHLGQSDLGPDPDTAIA